MKLTINFDHVKDEGRVPLATARAGSMMAVQVPRKGDTVKLGTFSGAVTLVTWDVSSFPDEWIVTVDLT